MAILCGDEDESVTEEEKMTIFPNFADERDGFIEEGTFFLHKDGPVIRGS